MQPSPRSRDPSGTSAVLLREWDRALNLLDRLAGLVVIIAMAVLTSVVTAQVFFRYVLNSSLDWGYDVPRLCFFFVVLLSIPLGFKRNAHVGIDLIGRWLSLGQSRILDRINYLLMGLLMAIVFYYATVLAVGTWPILMTTIDVSVGTFYVAMCISAFHTALHVIRRFIWADAPNVFEAPAPNGAE